MVFLRQRTDFSVRLWFYYNYSNHWFSICAIAILFVTTVLSFLELIDASFIEADQVPKSISSAF